MATETEQHNLFDYAMKGLWDKVVEVYKQNPKAREAKITKSEDTALHIAVVDGKTEIVLKLVGTLGENASKILHMKNARENAPLHLAAALGNVEMCQCMAMKDPKLITARNAENESPLFSAVLHGQEKAFLCLHFLLCQPKDNSLCRKNNGDTILHSAIFGEYFSLAFQIIHYYPDLVNFVNENGVSALHILASKPNAFRSSSRLRWFDRIIYHCLIVDELQEKKFDLEAYQNSIGVSNTPNYPANYENCIYFFRWLNRWFGVHLSKGNKSQTSCSDQMSYCFFTAKSRKKNGNRTDEENPQQMIGSSEGDRKAGEASPSTAGQGSGSNEAITGEASSSAMRLKSKNGTDQTKKEEKDQPFPPNYATCVLFFQIMMKALLIVLGVGIWRIKNIQEKKERHTWANQVMNELVKRASSYKYDGDNGQDPHKDGENLGFNEVGINSSAASKIHQNNRDQNPEERRDKPIIVAAKMGLTDMVDKLFDNYPAAIQELNSGQKNLVLLTVEKKETYEVRKKETPILIAAKMGVTEMVEKILEKFPVAIWDLDSDNKNVVLLAIENRQPHIYKLLLKRESVKESVFRQVDNQGNGALHLAATFGVYRPWLIPGSALQMQWEIKWYKFVRNSMPPHFFVRHNNRGQTPKEIFTDTHKELVKDGSEWLTKTSESCSVVAALIATVAFATSATVPGDLKQESGTPTLEGKPAFNVFAISSLVALCFSVTALVFFLSILTSRYQEKDFEMDLPRKLLLGLTSLFSSIASMLLSFCAGHFFVLKDDLKYAAYPIYAATCLPVTFFAFAQLQVILYGLSLRRFHSVATR